MKAETGEIRAEARLRTSHAEVGHHREPEAATNGGAVYGSYNRFFGAEEPIALDIERRDAWPGLIAAAALRVKPRTVAEIGSGAEGFALCCQHDGTNVAVFIEALEGAGNVLDQRDIEEIIWRPSELDQSDVAVLFNANVAHRFFSYSAALRCSACCAAYFIIRASTTLTPPPLAWTITGLRSICAIASA